eukprot:282538_1
MVVKEMSLAACGGGGGDLDKVIIGLQFVLQCVSQPIISHPILLHRMEPPKEDCRRKEEQRIRAAKKMNCTKRRTTTKSTKPKEELSRAKSHKVFQLYFVC